MGRGIAARERILGYLENMNLKKKVRRKKVECLVGVCLALRTLVREVKRTLTTVGSWLGAQLSLSTKHGLILGPRNKNLVYQLYSAWLCGMCKLCAPRTRSSTQ